MSDSAVVVKAYNAAPRSEERRKYAWERLQEWVPRHKVVRELMERFGVGQAQAYHDIRDVYEAVAEQRKMSRAAEAAALLEQIDAEVETLRDDDGGPLGRAAVSRALGSLWDMRAKLTGAYRDTTRVAVLIATAKEVTGLSDEQLDAMIDGAAKQLALPPGQTVDVEAQEAPAEPEPVKPKRARRRKSA